MLTQNTQLRLIFTVALGGKIDLLPRLFAYVKQVRAAVNYPSLLVDLGAACLPNTWLCDATDGRGMLVAMDALGYDAFHLGARDPLYARPDVVQGLQHTLVTRFAAGPWSSTVTRQGLTILLVNGANLLPISDRTPASTDLIVGLRYTDEAAQVARWRAPHRLLLLDCGAGDTRLGWLDVRLSADVPQLSVLGSQMLDLPKALPHNLAPDPTITGVVEFVQSEARYAERKRGTG
ncbi:MAG: hypothetical protein OHK0023_18300 [Anaerolineae bacterium]